MDEDFEEWFADWASDRDLGRLLSLAKFEELKGYMWEAWEAGQQTQRDAHDIMGEDN